MHMHSSEAFLNTVSKSYLVTCILFGIYSFDNIHFLIHWWYVVFHYVNTSQFILLLMDLEAFTLNCWGRHLFFVYLYVDARISFRVYALSGIPGFIYRPIFNCNKYCQVILHSICSSLCSYQCLKVTIALYSCRYLVSSV